MLASASFVVTIVSELSAPAAALEISPRSATVPLGRDERRHLLELQLERLTLLRIAHLRRVGVLLDGAVERSATAAGAGCQAARQHRPGASSAKARQPR